MTSATFPSWLREIDTILPILPHFLLTGNTTDLYPVPNEDADDVDLVDLQEALSRSLRRRGYRFLLTFDINAGVEVIPAEEESHALSLLGVPNLPRFPRSGQIGNLLTLLETIYESTERLALLVLRASRIVRTPSDLSPEEYDMFRRIDYLARTQTPLGNPVLFNPVFWQLDNERDVPPWFNVGNPRVRLLTLPTPDEGARRVAAEPMLRYRFDQQPQTHIDPVNLFVSNTSGMTIESMRSIVRIAEDQGLTSDQIDDAARSYRVGVTDNPWKQDHIRAKLSTAEVDLSSEVLGQDAAIRKTVDILTRSVSGLTGAHISGTSAGPRGVMFLAGPTGVGKTQLAKALTRLLFLDESAYIRFDMSEFSEEQSAARLIGSPPGYVGFDAGGELTGAIRQRPFSVVLFDEIEKAHPRILDKFLQILDDGRLTDSQGDTVFFTESIILFTSNLGIYRDIRDESGNVIERVPNVKPGTPYSEVEERVRTSIETYFTSTLNRPELLNRLGDNIVVFDFISPEIGQLILDRMIQAIRDRVRKEHSIEIKFADGVLETVASVCLDDLALGGRGIGAILETTLVDPLARSLVLDGAAAIDSGQVIAERLEERSGRWTLTLAAQ